MARERHYAALYYNTAVGIYGGAPRQKARVRRDSGTSLDAGRRAHGGIIARQRFRHLRVAAATR